MYSFSSFIETQFNTSIVQGLCLQSLADVTPLTTTTTGGYWPLTLASCPSHWPLALHTGLLPFTQVTVDSYWPFTLATVLSPGRPTSDLALSTATLRHTGPGGTSISSLCCSTSPCHCYCPLHLLVELPCSRHVLCDLSPRTPRRN